MTAPAIPEALEHEVYTFVLARKTYRWVSDWLQRRHGVQASPSAVQSCVRRVKEEKAATIMDISDDLTGGVEALDSIYRESRACALRAAEGGDVLRTKRALEHQLRVVRVHCEQVRRSAEARKTPMAPRQDPHSTPTGFARSPANQGLPTLRQGVAMTPTDKGGPAHAPEDMAIAHDLALQLDRVIEEQKARAAERRAKAAAAQVIADAATEEQPQAATH